MINSLKCYLCLQTFLIAEFMFLSTRWYKDLSDSSFGEVKLYSMSMIWIKDIVHCTSPSLKKPSIQWKNSTHWRNVELTWKCSNSTVISISHASETSSTLVNKLVEQVSQACLTSLARLVEPAWLVKSCLTIVKLVKLGTILTNVRLVVN